MRNRTKVALAVLLGTLCCTVMWQFLRAREPLYQGKTLTAWTEEGILGNHHAWSVLMTADPGNSRLRAEVEKQTVASAIKLLRTKDSRLWGPYTAVRRRMPAAFAQRMPEWRDPSMVRLETVRWLAGVARRGQEVFVPALSEASRNDPDPRVREFAITALSEIGVFSDELLPIMLNALTSSTNNHTRTEAARWFRRTTPEPERIVPILVRGLEDPAWKSDYAMALRGYGTKAKFAVGPLSTLARTNDKAVSSVAQWALQAIDSEAAAKASAP